MRPIVQRLIERPIPGAIWATLVELDIVANEMLGGGHETITNRIKTKSSLRLIQMLPHFRPEDR